MARIQLSLNVTNLDDSIGFYSKLFTTEPAKVKPGYANFSIENPPLKLVLIEGSNNGGTLNHLGVEVSETSEVDDHLARLTEAGLGSLEEGATPRVVFATQDKFWVENAPMTSVGRSTRWFRIRRLSPVNLWRSRQSPTALPAVSLTRRS